MYASATHKLKGLKLENFDSDFLTPTTTTKAYLDGQLTNWNLKNQLLPVSKQYNFFSQRREAKYIV
jgi:hypothetical protein